MVWPGVWPTRWRRKCRGHKKPWLGRVFWVQTGWGHTRNESPAGRPESWPTQSQEITESEEARTLESDSPKPLGRADPVPQEKTPDSGTGTWGPWSAPSGHQPPVCTKACKCPFPCKTPDVIYTISVYIGKKIKIKNYPQGHWRILLIMELISKHLKLELNWNATQRIGMYVAAHTVRISTFILLCSKVLERKAIAQL